MLDNGIVWIESSNGRITAVNYQSDFEKKLKTNLIANEKVNLHSSLKTFKNPTYKIKTKNYLIRIDELSNNKYRYASYALRFDLINTSENEEQFLRRLNAAAREDGERPDSQSGSERWVIGVNSRNTGSVHSDIWKGTAADIASCNLIGVYPVIGWWRERAWLGRWDRRARYSLIVSLHTPDENIDIYTPVAVQLGIPVEVMM